MPVGGPTVAKAYVAIIPTTKGAQKEIADGFLPAAAAAGDGAGIVGGDALTDAMSASIKKGAGKIAAGLAALGIGKMITDLTSGAVAGFSSMEQLTGGIETIFGEETGRRVEEMASTAFRRVQMSANDYLETVTGFSASLIQSMGGDTKAAADMADVALVDMADNANKMGTSMESLQNAYRGFARGTYTMLDNLSLGYGGNQEEMLRLVHDAGVVDAAINDINDVSFDQVIQGIHIIQERMGIAGASAAEAATTLEGSTSSMKAAWGDWLANLATGDMSAITRTTKNLGQAVLDWLSNLLPRIAITLGSLVAILPQALADIAAGFPSMAAALWQRFTSALASTDVRPDALVAPLSGLLGSSLGKAIAGLAGRVQEAFAQVFGDIDFGQVWGDIMTAGRGLLDTLGGIAGRVADFIAGALSSIDTATIASFFSLVRGFVDAVLPRVQQALALVGRIFSEVILPVIAEAWDYISTVVWPAAQQLLASLSPMLSGLGSLLLALFDGIMSIAGGLLDVIIPAVSIIWEILRPGLEWLMGTLADIASSVREKIGQVASIVAPFISQVLGWVGGLFSTMGRWLTENRDSIIAAIRYGLNQIGKIPGIVAGVIGRVVDGFLWVHDVISGVWRQVVSGVAWAMSSAWGAVSAVIDWIYRGFWGLVSGLQSAFSTLADALTQPFRSAFAAIKRLWNSTIGGFSFSLPDWIPAVGGASFRIPYLAEGGDIMTSGSVVVGEAGPELLSLPRGARVSPLDVASASGGDHYSVIVGDVDLTSDEQIKRATRDYLELLLRIAAPVSAGSQASYA